MTDWLEQTAKQAGIALPAGVAGIRVGPADAPTPPPHGTRRGTWAEATGFVQEWAGDGRAWVHIRFHISPSGHPYLSYEVQHRDHLSDPLPEGASPALNLSGPGYDHRVQSPA